MKGNIMKKLSILTMLFVGSLTLLTACDDDRDSNPIIQQPSTFVLNTPAYSTSNIDLNTSKTLSLTCSQPDYGYTAAVTYKVQLSLTNSFTTSVDEADENTTPDYAVIDNAYTTCNIEVDAPMFAKSLMQLAKWEENNMPSLQTVNVRLVASVDQYTIASNTIDLNVIPYYIELQDAMPEMWYLIGACIGDGKWTNSPSAIGTSIYPMSLVKDYEYDKKTGQGELTFTGYFTPEGFKLVHTLDSSWPDQWGQGTKFGDFVKNDGGSANITVPETGYYTVKLDTKNDKLTVEKAETEPKVYNSICMAGDFNEWSNTAMTPVNTIESMAAHNHIWSYVLDATSGDTTAKFKLAPEGDNDGWGTNWGGNAFPYGIGVSGGDNIPVTAGKYIVVFNDIEGSYTFTATE